MESADSIWRNFRKLILGKSMNYGTSISYNIEHACIIGGKYLLLRGWSYARDSYTETLISNCGFFLDKVPSMQLRQALFESNPLLSHPNVGIMYYKPIRHNFDEYLNIELVSDTSVVELNLKLLHYDSLSDFIASNPRKDMHWLSEICDKTRLKSISLTF